MKKFLAALLSIMILSTFAFFAVGSGESEKEEKTQQDGSAAAADETEIGDYQVEIKDIRLVKDYEGKESAIVKYSFTNNADEAAAFEWTFEHQVYQNGVALERAYVFDDSVNYDESNMSKEIKKGVTLELEVAYILNDTETDLVVEVSELISFDDTVISKTFSIK